MTCHPANISGPPEPHASEPDLFANPHFDPDAFRKDMQTKMGPQKNYLILFTPRSGSSWLGQLLEDNTRLGEPREWLNPNFLPRMNQRLNGDSPRNYLKMLVRKKREGPWFGMETTAFQARRSLGSLDELFQFFPPTNTTYFHLTRIDLLEQAVSLAKAVAHDLFHTTRASLEDVAAADASFSYQPDRFLEWAKHIREQEDLLEVSYRTHGIRPIRLTYESITQQEPETLVRFFEKTLLGKTSGAPLKSNLHSKIGTSLNRRYAQRIRKDYPGEVARLEEGRQLGA